jgi:hypothetical protein
MGRVGSSKLLIGRWLILGIELRNSITVACKLRRLLATALGETRALNARIYIATEEVARTS